jgi:hypothetical protein
LSLMSRIAFKASTNMSAASLMLASEHEAANGGQPGSDQGFPRVIPSTA